MLEVRPVGPFVQRPGVKKERVITVPDPGRGDSSSIPPTDPKFGSLDDLKKEQVKPGFTTYQPRRQLNFKVITGTCLLEQVT